MAWLTQAGRNAIARHMMAGIIGAKVKIVLHNGTEVTGRLMEPKQPFSVSPTATYNVEGLGYVGPVKSISVLEMPKPVDTFNSGTVLYAENNGYHHVWVKSGGKWYTANRVGTVSWDMILRKCDDWRMPLHLMITRQMGGPVYDPRPDVFVG